MFMTMKDYAKVSFMLNTRGVDPFEHQTAGHFARSLFFDARNRRMSSLDTLFVPLT
jgi:hypothetical protein